MRKSGTGGRQAVLSAVGAFLQARRLRRRIGPPAEAVPVSAILPGVMADLEREARDGQQYPATQPKRVMMTVAEYEAAHMPNPRTEGIIDNATGEVLDARAQMAGGEGGSAT